MLPEGAKILVLVLQSGTFTIALVSPLEAQSYVAHAFLRQTGRIRRQGTEG